MKKVQRIFLIGLVVLFSFTLGFLFGGNTETAKTFTTIESVSSERNIDLNPVWEAWKILDEKFVPASSTEKISEQEHVWGIIEGLADSYGDPYTSFFPPEQARQFEEEISGAFGGVGIEIGIRNDILTIIAPLKGTPAESAGLLTGDLIIEVNGNNTQSMDIDGAISLIRGEVGTVVTFKIAREGESEFLTIPVVRGTIEVPTLDKELRDDGIYVISLYNFGGTAIQETRNALHDFLESGSSKLILDLRGNPGGYLQAAVEIASWFLPIGKTVVIEDYGNPKNSIVHRSKGYDITEKDWRIAVLIDGGSASASEILAGALSEHKKAVLIGEETFGKGSVQELVKLTEATSLKITVARWLTPNGVSISKKGLSPDVKIKMTIEDMEDGMDPQFEAAVQYLTTGVLPQPSPDEKDTLLEKVDDSEEIE
jgi:carboxyl-terminal processing protease